MDKSLERTDAPSATHADPKMGDRIVNAALDFLNKVDDAECRQRVDKLRRKYPDASPEEIGGRLITSKSRKTGAVGAITASPAAIPGVGTVMALTFGSGVDITMTYTLQAELVIELAYCYGVELSQQQRRSTILMVTGISVGSSRVFTAAGKKLATKATSQFAGKGLARALPFIGIGASAGVNMASTYAVGKRAMAYFSMSEQERASWSHSARALTGVDERKLFQWLDQKRKQSWSSIEKALVTAKGGLVEISGSAIALVRSKMTKEQRTSPDVLLVSDGKDVESEN